MTTSWGHGVCAVHPDRRGSITCKHCGSYACSECTIDKLWGETLCAACDAKGVAYYPIPWDRSLSPWAFVATCKAVFSDLRLLFADFPGGSVLRALGFAAVTGSLVSGLFGGIGLVRKGQAVGTGIVFITVSNIVYVFANAGAFYLCQKMLRGQATLAMSTRVSAYLTTLYLVSAGAMVLPGMLAIAVMVGVIALYVWAWQRFGTGRARLTPGAAWSASIISAVVATAISFVVGGIIAAIYGAVVGEIEIPDQS